MQKIFCGSKNYCGGIMKLVELLPNQTAKVVKLDMPDVRIKRRICALGIFEGETVTFLKSSMLKKVVLVSVKNYVLCLKSSIAKSVEVQIG